MSDNTQLQQAITRIAKMDNAGVPYKQIANACSIELSELAQLMEKQTYQQELAKVAGESFDKMDVLNGGWDLVENLAMTKVVDHLQATPDPDYALKAAALANRAVRRGRHENNPIGLQPNKQAIINVSLQFADKLQQNFNVPVRDQKELMQKDDNFLPPKNVQTLLSTSDSKKTEKVVAEIEDEIGDLGAFAPSF